MGSALSPSRVALLAAALLVAAPSIGFSQTAVPTREGNIWGGLNHQPQRAQVARDEQAAGIALLPKQERAATQEVERLYRYLIRDTPPPAG